MHYHIYHYEHKCKECKINQDYNPNDHTCPLLYSEGCEIKKLADMASKNYVSQLNALGYDESGSFVGLDMSDEDDKTSIAVYPPQWIEENKNHASITFRCPHCKRKVYFHHKRYSNAKRCSYEFCPWCGKQVMPLRINYIND